MQRQGRRRIVDDAQSAQSFGGGDLAARVHRSHDGEIEIDAASRRVELHSLCRNVGAHAVTFPFAVAGLVGYFRRVMRCAVVTATAAMRYADPGRFDFAVAVPMVMAAADHRVDDQQNRRQIWNERAHNTSGVYRFIVPCREGAWMKVVERVWAIEGASDYTPDWVVQLAPSGSGPTSSPSISAHFFQANSRLFR